jgi:hypothetical protein
MGKIGLDFFNHSNSKRRIRPRLQIKFYRLKKLISETRIFFNDGLF